MYNKKYFLKRGDLRDSQKNNHITKLTPYSFEFNRFNFNINCILEAELIVFIEGRDVKFIKNRFIIKDHLNDLYNYENDNNKIYCIWNHLSYDDYLILSNGSQASDLATSRI